MLQYKLECQLNFKCAAVHYFQCHQSKSIDFPNTREHFIRTPCFEFITLRSCYHRRRLLASNIKITRTASYFCFYHIHKFQADDSLISFSLTPSIIDSFNLVIYSGSNMETNPENDESVVQFGAVTNVSTDIEPENHDDSLRIRQRSWQARIRCDALCEPMHLKRRL